jgi:hypothetical protein
MPSQLLYRLSGLALILGSLFYAVSSPYLDPLHLPMVAIGLAGSYLIVLGLPGLYIRQAGKAGVLGLIGFVGLFVSLIALTVVEYTYVVIVPITALQLPPPLPFQVPFPLFVLLSMVLFGIATIRAGVLPRAVGIAFFVNPVVMVIGFVVPTLLIPAFVLSNLAVFVGGIELIRSKAVLVQGATSAS